MSIDIRPANAEDLERLLPLVEAFHRQDGYPFEPRLVRRVLGRLLASPELGRVWVAEAGAEAVGYCVLCFGYSIEFEGRDAFVDELFVREDRRGAGLGARLLRAAEGGCREAGVAALHLEVERNNERAHALYRRRGYGDHDRYLLTKWIGRDGEGS